MALAVAWIMTPHANQPARAVASYYVASHILCGQSKLISSLLTSLYSYTLALNHKFAHDYMYIYIYIYMCVCI